MIFFRSLGSFGLRDETAQVLDHIRSFLSCIISTTKVEEPFLDLICGIVERRRARYFVSNAFNKPVALARVWPL